jgi:hypothetical protein
MATKITSRFFIFTYDGKSPLDLFSVNFDPSDPPSVLVSVQDAALPVTNTTSSTTDTDISKFINNVSIIYASEETNGIIPTFYKTAGVADKNSTLKFLESGKAYYVIMNSSATYPVTVPSVGGVLPCSGTSGDCKTTNIPSITFPAPSFTLEGENNNYQYLTVGFSNLTPGVTYQYNFSNSSSNWPIKILPLTGTFTPQAAQHNVNAYVMFASSLNSNDCPDCFTNYKLDPDYKEFFAQNNLYASVQVNIVAEPFDVCSKISSTIPIRCKSCLPRKVELYPVIKFESGPKLILSGDCGSQTVPIKVNCTNFDKGKAYKYTFSIAEDALIAADIAATGRSAPVVTPDTGIVGFGDGVGQIATLLNINNYSPVILKILVEAQDGTNKTSTDFLTVECSNCQ